MSRGLKPGGLRGSKWAAGGGHDSSYSPWSTRRPSYTRRHDLRDSSAIIPATPQPSETSTSEGKPWWESTQPPSIKGSQANTRTPSPAKQSPSQQSFSSAQKELRRYVQIVRRMKWKLPYLSDGYAKAIGSSQSLENGAAAAAAATSAAEDEIERQEAELMFKLDFFEFYMLLERALVHLLGVFGQSVTAEHGGPAGAGGATTARNGGTSTHAYHHNILAALEFEGNPLHHALGRGEVRRHLFRAKDLRNRWKYAEDTRQQQQQQQQQGAGCADRVDAEREGQRVTGRAPLESYDLDSMFTFIFAGFDQGYLIAEEWVGELARKADMVPTNPSAHHQSGHGQQGGGVPSASTSTGGGGGGGVDRAVGMQAAEMEEFDFIVDAMDWEAI